METCPYCTLNTAGEHAWDCQSRIRMSSANPAPEFNSFKHLLEEHNGLLVQRELYRLALLDALDLLDRMRQRDNGGVWEMEINLILDQNIWRGIWNSK